MTIQTITRRESAKSAMAAAMVKAGLVEDREVLVEERAMSIAPKYGEQKKAKGPSDVQVLATWMASVATMNSFDEEAALLFLQELSCEEKEESRKSVIKKIKRSRRLGKVIDKKKREATETTLSLLDTLLNVGGGDVVNIGHINKMRAKRDALMTS